LGDLGVLEHEGLELPRGHAGGAHVVGGGDRGRARAVVDQRDLAEPVARAQRVLPVAVDLDAGVALEQDPEARAGLALLHDHGARREGALGESTRQPLEVAAGDVGQERHPLEGVHEIGRLGRHEGVLPEMTWRSSMGRRVASSTGSAYRPSHMVDWAPVA
jgi:hypothetical protein